MPGLHLFTSNRLETLSVRLAGVLSASPPPPFQTELVIVQSLGMAKWLALEIARHLGICANVEFSFPRAFIEEAFQEATGKVSAGLSPFGRDALTWRIMELLPEFCDNAEFASVMRYLADDDERQLKLYQLAQKIASLYDQYLVFRPEMILRWERSVESPTLQQERWQAILWRRITETCGNIAVHPAAMRELFFTQLAPSSSLPRRLSVFGVTHLPPLYLDILAALARQVDLYFFVHQPCQEFWGDIVSEREESRHLQRLGMEGRSGEEIYLERGNALLASLGSLGKDFFNLLQALNFSCEESAFATTAQHTLLSTVQEDILFLRNRGTPMPRESLETPPPSFQRDQASGATAKMAISPQDRSIQFHACHSPLREMEVLYDLLLDAFNHDPDLQPRDIVVMVPDIESYAPYIEAVFDVPEDEARRIPFAIADCTPLVSSATARTFLALLALPEGRFEASALLGLLEAPSIREKFQIGETEFELLSRWVEQVQIRWGIDARHRKELNLPELDANTWRQGLDRILLGYATDAETLFSGVLPFSDIPSDAFEMLGRAMAFADAVFALAQDLKIPRPIREWRQFFLEMLECLFASGDSNEQELHTLREILEHFALGAEQANQTEPVSIDVVKEHLTEALRQDRHALGFISGGLTFCALKPMRSIPFKIICLAGMNDRSFPRTTLKLGFDLMAPPNHRLGDRSLRDDDRYLFLEAILSARQRLYISYVGQSSKDNSELPPSSVVSELLEYLLQGFELTPGSPLKDHLVTRHPLQAFSPKYFCGGPLISYSSENSRASRQSLHQRKNGENFILKPLEKPEEEWRKVELTQLIAFLESPAQYLLTHRLGLQIVSDESFREDCEPMDLGKLDAYALRHYLLDCLLEGKDISSLYPLLAASGKLPHGHIGEGAFQALCSEAREFASRLETTRSWKALEPIPLETQRGNFHVSGQINHLTDHGILRYRCSALKAKDRLKAWVNHLALNMLSSPEQVRESHLIAQDKRLKYSPTDRGGELFDQLLELYWEGLRRPLEFFNETSLAYIEAAQKQNSKSKKTPIEQARTQWDKQHGKNGNFLKKDWTTREEKCDSLCFGIEPALSHRFKELAACVYRPLLEQETEGDL